MDGYRDSDEAAKLRIDTLEAQLEETKSAVKARDAEVAELQRRVQRAERGPRPPAWHLASLIFCVVAALSVSVYLAIRLDDASDRSSDAQERLAAAESEAAAQRTRVAEAKAEAARLEERLASRARESCPGESDGLATLVAIAIGGACFFMVDGEQHGTSSSLRIRIAPGPHTVTCTPPHGDTISQRLNVRSDKPAMATFRIR